MNTLNSQFPSGRFRLTPAGKYVRQDGQKLPSSDTLCRDSLSKAAGDEVSAASVSVLQFAVGGRVYPPPDRWIKITERFRGQVLRLRAQQVSGKTNARFDELVPAEREQLQLLSGKDADGRPLPNHRHTYFILWPDEYRQPTRLVCLRNSAPFSAEEVDALLCAAERSYSWEFGNPDRLLRLVPLPFETAAPQGLCFGEFANWTSKTPCVPPGNRHRFRKNGRERRGELPHEVLRKLIAKHGLPDPQRIDPLDAADAVVAAPETLTAWSEIAEWVYIHEPRAERQLRCAKRTRAVRPGYRFRIAFPEPVPGPICLGHSAHFGLGLFAPDADLEAKYVAKRANPWKTNPANHPTARGAGDRL